jgi:hypothetical protein
MGVSSTPHAERDRDRASGDERAATRSRAVPLSAAELAWVAALPCALATLAALRFLAPALGDAFFDPKPVLWPHAPAFYVVGEADPLKHGRYVVALLGPVALALVVLLGARRPPRLPPAATRVLVTTTQLLLALGLALAMRGEWDAVYHGVPATWQIFTAGTLLVALALAAAIATLPRVPALARWLARQAAPSRPREVACWALAALATVVWLAPAVTTDGTIANGPFPDLPPWAMGDTYAILDGRTPLVDFHPIYGHLWAYVAAAPMALLGASITVFSLTMTCANLLALLAVYALLRRVARNALLALALYLPLLATSLFVVPIALPWRLSNAAIYSVFPMRYAGPLVLAWLTARQLDGARGGRDRHVWLLFAVAGLVAINNIELGVGALAGSVLALACAPERWSWRGLARLAGSAAAGVLAAVALFSLLTLVRAGELPHFGILMEYPRLFGVLGLASLEMPDVAFHLVIYATLGAALVLAAVRVARREPDVLLTGMLAWSGIFGLAAGSYYMGRSDPPKLASLFPAWALALSLLLVVVLRALAARAWRRPTIAELLVLFGFGLCVCSLAQLPPPWDEPARLSAHAPRIYDQPVARRFVERTTRPGEHVAIVIQLGHRIAYEAGVVNVAPYGSLDEMATQRQLRNLIDAMHAEGAHKLYAPKGHLAYGHRRMLEEEGGLVKRATEGDYELWSDAGG